MGSAGFTAGPGALIQNDVWSVGPATLQDRVSVRGTVHATTIKPGNGTTIAKTDTTPRIYPTSTLSWTVTYPTGTGPNVTLNAGQAQTLSPGLYGSINLGSQSTLTLSTGTYYVSSFVVQNAQTTVNLNQANGPVILYVASSLTLNGGSFIPLGGTDGGTVLPNLLIGYLGTTPLNVNSVFDGAIIAPSAQLTLNATTGVYKGFFYAQSIVLQSNVQVQYAMPVAAVAAADPPGSQCAQLLAGSVPALQIMSYCKKCSSFDDTDRDGVPDCVDGCPYDHSKVAPGICGCNSPDVDSDGDGVPDCIDPCRSDPNNVEVGQCGCVGMPGLRAVGTPCKDTACPQTGATCNGAGVCGNRAACSPCAGGKYINEFGTSYWICGSTLPPQTGPDGGTETVSTGAPASESAAQTACSSKGLTLGRIDTPDQNRLIARLITGPAWLGANDIAASGKWVWSVPGSNNGTQFWSGGATGTRQNGLYANWGKGAPGAANCASMLPIDGHWFDTSCSETLGYFCEYHPPPPGLLSDAGGGNGGWGNGGGGGGNHQPAPMSSACVDQFDLDAGGLPDSLAELINEVDAARTGTRFYGVAANPPPDGSTVCPSQNPDAAPGEAIGQEPSTGAGCAYAQAQKVNFPSGGVDGGPYTGDCMSDMDCTTFVGPSFVCRQLQDNWSYPIPDGGTATSLDAGASEGHAWCVELQCPLVQDTCREIRVCSDAATDFDARLDPGSNLDSGTFSPATLFGGTLPDASPSASYVDPAEGTGPNHTWCHMVPQNPVPAANQPSQNNGGSSGRNTPLSFSFDPNLVFDVNANPLAFGENAMDIRAAATLVATVQLNNFLGQSYTADIVDIGAGVHAHRCSVDNDETQFIVLGVDVLSLLGVGVPHFNSANPPNDQITRDCNDAVSNFAMWSNRAKKAFRDAQQLLWQYQQAKLNGGQLASTLCQDILSNVPATDIPFFPEGLLCPQGEPVEQTINRFVDYLQAPGVGQIAQLRNAASNLVAKSQAVFDGVLPNLDVNFLDIEQDESQTILNVPFAIGPVPMVLQVDVFASYGIDGKFQLHINAPLAQMAGLDDAVTTQPGDTSATPFQIARVETDVMPFASAGLSAFVGAGVDLGAFSATVGIEGSVTLGQVSAPIYAGAGLDLLEQFDPRPLPIEISSVSIPGDVLQTAFHFSQPKSFNMMVWFDYGAGLQLTNILSGEIDVRLHISFFFFSETWRARIVHFNGWSQFYNLVNGGFGSTTSTTQQNALGTSHLQAPQGSTTVVSTGTQGPSMGLAEPQLPLTVLAHLALPDAAPPLQPPTDGGSDGPSDANVASVDGSSDVTTDAGGSLVDSGGDVNIVFFDATAIQAFFYDNLCCAKGGQSCSPVGDPHCCADYQCVLDDAGDPDSGSCQIVCVPDGGACTSEPAGCCGGLFCGPGNTCLACLGFGLSCSAKQPCCSGLECGANGSTCCGAENSPCTDDSQCCFPKLCSIGGGTCYTPEDIK
jgi:hypothetical protein